MRRIINKYVKFIPYFYFISVTAYWFTMVNKTAGISAYPILLFGIPFLWQLIKPCKALNFTLAISFVCLSSYLVIAYFFDILQVINYTSFTRQLLFFSGVLVIGNLTMSLWMLRNSLLRVF